MTLKDYYYNITILSGVMVVILHSHYLRERDLIWQPSLLVQVLFIMLAVLTVQPHVVDDAQGHEYSPPAVVLPCPIRLVLGVRSHHPLV